MFKCEIDKKEFETEKALHSYISRTLKTKLEEYYPKYFPRYDKLTGEPILYKDKDHYMASFFNNRENLVTYFKKNKDYNLAKEILKARKELKYLYYAPCTVEARTSIIPTPILIKNIGGDYNSICKSIALVPRYDYDQILDFELKKPLSILIDTREQIPLPFKNSIESKLDFGDYTTSSHYKRIFIERKSLVDLCGTLSKGFERLEKEIIRAKEMDAYIIIMVEDNIKLLNNLPKYVKASTEFISSRCRSICQTNENVQFLFVNNRIEMLNLMERIFRMTNDIKTVDLQFFYDSKGL